MTVTVIIILGHDISVICTAAGSARLYSPRPLQKQKFQLKASVHPRVSFPKNIGSSWFIFILMIPSD